MRTVKAFLRISNGLTIPLRQALVVAVLALAAPTSASQRLVNVDVFGPTGVGPNSGDSFSETGVLGGGTWNELGTTRNFAVSAVNLLDSNGNVTSAGLYCFGVGGYWGDYGGGRPDD